VQVRLGGLACGVEVTAAHREDAPALRHDRAPVPAARARRGLVILCARACVFGAQGRPWQHRCSVDAYQLQLVSVVAVLVIANAKLAQVVLVPPRQRERQQEDESGDDPGLWR
jgi:hypothetical protein